MSNKNFTMNELYDSSKNEIYNEIIKYYNNPKCTKIKNVNNYSTYMVKIHALLANAQRYLVIFCLQDNRNIKDIVELKYLKWVSFQTRTLEYNHDIPKYSYDINMNSILNQEIKVSKRDDNQSTYETTRFPIIITLLHIRKKNSKYQYHHTGNILSALETFQTIINFK